LWQNREVMDVRVPLAEDEKALKTAVKDYRIWADIHRKGLGEKAVTLKTYLDSMRYDSEISSSKIVEDIKGKIRNHSDTPVRASDWAARIFLYFAQEFDRQNDELTRDLTRYDQQEEELIRRLKMDDDPVVDEFRTASTQLPDPFADYMISDRLEAWNRIFCQDPEIAGLFVTHSSAVMEHMLDRVSTAIKVIHLESIPLVKKKHGEQAPWQKIMALNLGRLLEPQPLGSGDGLIEQPDLPVSDTAVSLSVYQVPDQTPHEIFCACSGIHRSAGAGTEGYRAFNNTLIALVQDSSKEKNRKCRKKC